MVTPKLKPCPFCSETPDVDGEYTFATDDGGKWGAVQCCCRGPQVRTFYEDVEHWRDDAIEVWNERAEPKAESGVGT